MKQKYMDSPGPTLGLAMAASCLFMWGRNWHMYTWDSLGISLVLVIGAALLQGLLFGWLARAAARSKWLTVLLKLLVGWLLVEVLLVFLDIPARQWAVSLGLERWHLKIPLALAVFTALYAARGFRLLNTVLLAWLFIALAGGLVNIHSAPAEEKFPKAGFSVTLKKKPNIYLYFLEAYHSPYAMRLIYDHDAGPMVKYLKGKNFLVYDRTLSNSSDTLMSMTDIFMMRLYSKLSWGNMDARPQVRVMIGGSDDNHLFKILKDNGYHLTFITMDRSYYFRVQGPNLDAADIGSCLVTPLLDLNPRRFQLLLGISWDRQAEGRFSGTRAERVRQAVERGQKRGGPFMVIFKGGADHTPGTYQASRQEFEAWKPKYLNWVAEGDAEIKGILEYLDEADPEALVILIGDHGAWGYRSVLAELLKTGDFELFNRQLTERGVTLDQVVQDVFGTFLAVRLPGGVRRDISRGLALNHVNLFRHIFAELNDEPNILNTREPALSVIKTLILGRDNQPVLERYEADK